MHKLAHQELLLGSMKYVSHWDIVTCILRYIKDAMRQRLLCEEKGNTKITYYSYARSGAEMEYRAMATTTCELT